MFNFDYNTTAPLQCAALVFLKAYIMLTGLFLELPIKIRPDAYQTNSVWINERFQICLVTLDSTFTKTILGCSNYNSVFCITKNLLNVSIVRFI